MQVTSPKTVDSVVLSPLGCFHGVDAFFFVSSVIFLLESYVLVEILDRASAARDHAIAAVIEREFTLYSVHKIKKYYI